MKEIDFTVLAGTLTFITDFMCDKDNELKNYAQLLAIYNRCSPNLNPKFDTSKDLRVGLFINDMKHGNWTSDVVITRRFRPEFGQRLIDDGIHRGIAYLACIEKGVNEAKLPKLYIDEQ